MSHTHNFTDVQDEDIDWDLFSSINKNLPFEHKLFQIKWYNNLLPIHKMEHKIGQIPSAACPSDCGCPIENHYHLLQCMSNSMHDAWKLFYKSLEATLDNHQINPGLRRTLYNILTKIHPISNPKDLTETYDTLYHDQLKLGPRSIFMGLFILDWTTIQLNFRKLNNLPTKHNQAQLGIIAIGRALFQHVLNLWKL